MCNCNQKRAIYTHESRPLQRGNVKVQLIGETPMVVNGEITGRMYVFKSKNDINWVDKRDAISMDTMIELQVLY